MVKLNLSKILFTLWNILGPYDRPVIKPDLLSPFHYFPSFDSLEKPRHCQIPEIPPTPPEGEAGRQIGHQPRTYCHWQVENKAKTKRV